MKKPDRIEQLIDDFEAAVKEAAYSDCSAMGDPGNYYKHMERDEARVALTAGGSHLQKLCEQIEKCSPMDDHGHPMTMNKTYQDACKFLKGDAT